MKKILFIIVSLVLSVSTKAQSITDLYQAAPDSVFLSVDSVNRVSLCAPDKNAVTIFGDSITVNAITSDYLSYQSSNERVEVKLLGNVIAVITTVNDNNTELSFYDCKWNLKSSWIYGVKHSKYMPNDKTIFNNLFVKPETMSDEEYERLKLYLDPMLVKCTFTNDTQTIQLTPVCPLLTNDENKELEPLLKSKTFKWTNGKFK